MRRITTIVALLCAVGGGCQKIRFAPEQAQKKNAWLHHRTTAIASQKAREENTSGELQSLAELSELQSRAFVSYYGLPEEFPEAQTVDDVLSTSNAKLTRTAIAESAKRPDPWKLVDGALEFAIGIAGLLGGVYGARTVGFLKNARAKSKALKEIVDGNELFKKDNQNQKQSFKLAHRNQSPQTRQIVTQMKGT